MMERIEAWLRVRDAARFQAEMNQSAASVERVGAAGKVAAGGLAAMTKESLTAEAALRKTGLAMDGYGKKMMATGHTMRRYITTPILGIGAAAGWMAMNFEQEMTLIETQAGAPRGEIQALHDDVLALAKDSTFGPTELAKGLFHLESIGLRGAKAMDALKIASQGAMVGNADLESVTTALGSAWLVNIKGAGNLRHVMAELNATTGAGNVRMSDLVMALGTGILPASKEAGLSIHDVMGAMALFTDEGYQASSAAAQFSTALHFLYNPTDKARTAMEGMGLSGDQLARDMRKPKGLLVALRDLQKHLDTLPGGHKGITAMQTLGQILPGGRGRIMLTLLNQLDRYDMKLNQIKNTAGRFGQSVKQSQETPLNKLKKSWAGIQVSLVKLGNDIIPMVVPLLQQLATDVQRLSDWFNKLDPSTKKWLIKMAALLAIAGPVLGFVGLMTRGVGGLFRGVGWLIGGLSKATMRMNRFGKAATVAGTEAKVAGGVGGRGFGTAFLAGATAFIVGWDIGKILRAKVPFIRSIGDSIGTTLGEAVFGKVDQAAEQHADAAYYSLQDRLRYIDIRFRIGSLEWWLERVKVTGPGAKDLQRFVETFDKQGRPRIHGTKPFAEDLTNTPVVGHPRRRRRRRPTFDLRSLPGLASGGEAYSAGWSVVGETGPELRYLPTGAKVAPLKVPTVKGISPTWFDSHGKRTIIVPVQLKGREIARVTAEDTDDNIARL